MTIAFRRGRGSSQQVSFKQHDCQNRSVSTRPVSSLLSFTKGDDWVWTRDVCVKRMIGNALTKFWRAVGVVCQRASSSTRAVWNKAQKSSAISPKTCPTLEACNGAFPVLRRLVCFGMAIEHARLLRHRCLFPSYH